MSENKYKKSITPRYCEVLAEMLKLNFSRDVEIKKTIKNIMYLLIRRKRTTYVVYLIRT